MSDSAENRRLQLAGAMVAVTSHVPDDALTAGLLGTERSGHGVRVRDDGLVATVNYLVTEADQIWLTTGDGKASAAYIVGQDYDSGLALVRPTLPIGNTAIQSGSISDIDVGDALFACNNRGGICLESKLVNKQEFVGRWEYLLDQALYTAPAVDNWAGAVLVDDAGIVYGIGSLFLEMPGEDGKRFNGNMFIPLELVMPYLDEISEHGRRLAPARPWMGSLIQEHEGQLIVVGTYSGCPAERAGLKSGDVVLSVDNEPVTSLSDMFRKIWSLGSAGVEIPLTVSDSGTMRTCLLKSIDRTVFDYRKAGQPLN
jgi:S1-C subfamily serine protease